MGFPRPHALERSFGEILARRPPPQHLGVAVSGGADSVALFRLLLRFQTEFGLALTIIHIDHGLRPESLADADWVEDLARTHAVQFQRRKLSSAPLSPVGGIEAWARLERLRIFGEIAGVSSLDAIALGHQAQDQSETILLRLMRGASLSGLSGMRSKRTLQTLAGPATLWRPLLAVSPIELRTYLQEINQEWREDKTNRSPAFLRNRLRHELLPLMEAIRPQSSFHLREAGRSIREMQALLNRRARAILKTQSPGKLEIFRHRPAVLWREILRQWWIREAPQQVQTFNAPLCKRLLDLIRNPNSGRRILCGPLVIIREPDCLRLVTQDRRTGELANGFAPVPLRPGETISAPGASFILSLNKDPSSTECVWVPEAIVQSGLWLRFPGRGDSIKPTGHLTIRKLSRWFIKQKIPQKQRQRLIVVTPAKTVIWVPGLIRSAETSEEYRSGYWFLGRIPAPA